MVNKDFRLRKNIGAPSHIKRLTKVIDLENEGLRRLGFVLRLGLDYDFFL